MLTDAEKDAIRDHYRTIADNLPGFRPRAAQRRMLAEIATPCPAAWKSKAMLIPTARVKASR